MCKYADIPFILIQVEALEALTEDYKKLLPDVDLSFLNVRRNELIEQYNSLKNELEAIKADDQEVYQLIYWHYIKRKGWNEAYNIVCAGLYHANRESYCRHRVNRYLKKHNLIQ